MEIFKCKMKNAGVACLVAIMLFHSSLFAAPEMPMGFVAAVTNSSGKTWCEIGSLKQPFAMACATIRTSMRAQGYTQVHDIAENQAATRRLLFWRRNDEDVIIMVWQEDLSTTGVSWGISSRDDDGDEPGFPKGR